MGIILTGPCKFDIEKLKVYCKNTRKHNYVIEMLNYIETLSSMPQLGKRILEVKYHQELRQLIFREHKIIYQVKENIIYIEAVIHSSINPIDFLNQLFLFRN